MGNSNPDMQPEQITITENEIAGTLYGAIFVIGSGQTPQVSLPKGRGIKKTILQERAEAEAAGRL